jgi:AcrR family transcriptional regulator
MRRYDSRRRQEQARRTRAEVLAVAREMFLAGGYQATTIAAIAAAAGVAVDTVYKAFANKAGLVRAIGADALAGPGPVHAERRSDELQAAGSDPRAVIAGWGELTAEVAPRIAPILMLVRAAAATDAEMARLRDEMDEDRLARMQHNAGYLADGGHLRPGMTRERARDILWAYTAPELFDALVHRRGWTAQEFGRFVADAVSAAVLAPTVSSVSRGPEDRVSQPGRTRRR